MNGKKESGVMTNSTVAFVSIFLAVLMLTACESEEAKKTRQDTAFKACIESYESKCNQACEKDPKFMYCASKYGTSVVGSGCASFMNSMSFTYQVDTCKREACSADYAVISSCTKESR
ncbi:MAG: hypothetical protein KF888_07625 [Nitrosomonas sp.]|nr:hypothetical protein [Nitrosomonas sp.]